MISFKTIVEMTQQFRPMIRARALLTVLAVVILVIPATAAALEIGDQAPGFELPGSDGATHRLSDYLGERPVVLAFFPKAFTGG